MADCAFLWLVVYCKVKQYTAFCRKSKGKQPCFTRSGMEDRKGKKRPGKRLAAVAALGILLLLAFDPRLAVRRYQINARQMDTPIRMALVTDLHSCFYGKNQQNLLQAIHREQPDLVLLGGDIFDDALPDENARLFLEGLKGIYPCYYVPGNHEYWAGEAAFQQKMQILKDNDVVILRDENVRITINGETFLLCGMDDPDAVDDFVLEDHLDAARKGADPEECMVLLSHRPWWLDIFGIYGFDLVLSGHAHGGQWRIPGLVNGLFAPDQGLFPDCAGGLYERYGTTLIVSRGLARESTLIPRLFNRPELVIVDMY